MGAAEVRKMTHGVDVQIESVDDTVQRIYNIEEGVSDGAQLNPTDYLRQAERFIQVLRKQVDRWQATSAN